MSVAGKTRDLPMRATRPRTLRALPRALIAGVVGAMSLFGAGAASALEFAKHATDGDNVNAIAVRGKVMPGDTAALKAYIARLPAKPVTAVYLDSPGGSLEEGMALGRYFHSAGILPRRPRCRDRQALARQGLGGPPRLSLVPVRLAGPELHGKRHEPGHRQDPGHDARHG